MRVESARIGWVGNGSVSAVDLRLLTEDDAEASTLMSHHAFGAPAGGVAAFTLGGGVRRWGLFDGETLAAKANERGYDSMIGGRRVATAGVAGVAVAPEYRGRGLARRVMGHLLRDARDRGAPISTLFRTAPALYRSLGFEQVAEIIDGTYPTSALRGIRPLTTTVRRARPEDAPAIRQVYSAVATGGSCLLTRDGASFEITDEQLVASSDGITLAIDAGGSVVGYASWNRGTGYGPEAALSVVELMALTGDGYRALLSAVGSFDAVTPTIRLRTSGLDPLHWLIPGAGWEATEVRPYMLRVVDLAAAVAARGWPAGSDIDVPVVIDDSTCPWNSGSHRLTVRDGQGHLQQQAVGDRPTELTVCGLALLFAGDVRLASLRRAGLASGGSDGSDAQLDAVFAGPRPAILDYF